MPELCKCCGNQTLYIRKDDGRYCRPCDGTPMEDSPNWQEDFKKPAPKSKEWADRG